MNKALILCLSLAAICAIDSPAAEGDVRIVGTATRGNRYSPSVKTWAEGTIVSKGADGRVSLRGTQSPYASDYFTYHHDYVAHPELRPQLGERYRDKFRYHWSEQDLKDYTFAVPDYSDAVIYDEPNYGTDYTAWSYDGEPRAYRYGDLNVGDRVAIGYDENGNRVQSIYRINPRAVTVTAPVPIKVLPNLDHTRPNVPIVLTPETHPDNTRPKNIGTSDNTLPKDVVEPVRIIESTR